MASMRYLQQEATAEGPQPHPDVHSKDSPSGFVLALAMTTVFVVFVMFPLCLLGRRRRQRLRQAQLQRQALDAYRSRATSGGDDVQMRRQWESRYHTVESWIVTKPAHEHDDVCQALTGPNGSASSSGAGSGAVADTPEDVFCEGWERDEGNASECGESECPICFERLEAGELLSWSANPQCDHVFHHGCIKEWLLDRRDCPFCRTVFLPVDAFGTREALATHIPDLILGQKRRIAPCFYCLEHRVVRSPSSTQLDAMNLNPMLRLQIGDRSTHLPDRMTLSGIRRRLGRDTNGADRVGSEEVSAAAYDGGNGSSSSIDPNLSHHRTNPRRVGEDTDQSVSEQCHPVECLNDEISVLHCPPSVLELEGLDGLIPDRSLNDDRLATNGSIAGDPCEVGESRGRDLTSRIPSDPDSSPQPSTISPSDRYGAVTSTAPAELHTPPPDDNPFPPRRSS
jgi:Ring finger domain